MNKIIPIICIIFAVLGSAVTMMGIVTVSVATQVSALAIVAVPTAIVGGVISGISTAVTALFFRDKLCRIAFVINVTALAVSLISIIIWLAVL